MENIFLKIDKIFEGDEDIPPRWAKELLCEIREIKKLLKNEKVEIPTLKAKQNGSDINSFIRGFRKMLKKDEKFNYQARELSFNTKGLLYDINTKAELSSSEAYLAYGYIFKNNIKIEKIDFNEIVINV